MTKSEHIAAINKLRLANKNQWYFYDGGNFRLKAFGTWVQIFETDSVRDGSVMEMNVTAFKNYLSKVIPE